MGLVLKYSTKFDGNQSVKYDDVPTVELNWGSYDRCRPVIGS